MGRPGYIYVMRLHVSDHWPDCPFKIGQSVNPEIRRSQLGIVMPYELSIVKWIKTNDMDWAEYLLHESYEGYRAQGEWYFLNEDGIVTLLTMDEFNNESQWNSWTGDGRFIRKDHPNWKELIGNYLPF